MLLTCIRGEAWPRVPPPPSRAERRLGYPQANFFIFSKQFFLFFLPIPITSSIYPFFLSLRGFLFLCVYFPIHVSFLGSEGKKRVNMNCFSYRTCVYVVIMRPILILHSHSLLFSMLCFSVESPYCFALCVMFLYCLLLWMLCFSLICPFFCPLWGFLCFYVNYSYWCFSWL